MQALKYKSILCHYNQLTLNTREVCNTIIKVQFRNHKYSTKKGSDILK